MYVTIKIYVPDEQGNILLEARKYLSDNDTLGPLDLLKPAMDVGKSIVGPAGKITVLDLGGGGGGGGE